MFFRSTRRKRPDIPIYVPRARREAASNNISTIPNTSSSTFSSNLTSPNKLDSNNKLYSKKIKGSFSELNINKQQHKCALIALTSLNSKCIDLSNDMLVNNVCDNQFKSVFNDVSSQILKTSNLPDIKNKDTFNPDLSLSNKTIKIKSPILKHNELEANIEGTNFSNIANASDLPQCSSDNVNSTCIQNSILVNLPDFQISNINNEIIADNTLESQEIKKSNPDDVDTIQIIVNENIENMSDKQYETHIESEVDDSSTCKINSTTEYDSNCTYCLDDSFTSGPLMDVEEKNFNDESEELTVQQSSKFVNKPIDIFRNDEKQNNIQKENKKKKVLNVDECSWEDLYDKEDDYIHPLLMKEVSYYLYIFILYFMFFINNSETV